MSTLKKEYILEGLCCGNCAAKIEKDVKELHGVVNASVSAKAMTLALEHDSSIAVNELDDMVTGIVHSHDDDIVIKEKIF